METLTKKQESVFKFIEKYQLQYGKSPTIREMRMHLKVNSDNSILKHIKGLLEKGYIEKDDTPRGIKLLSSVKEKLEGGGVKIPLLGSIPAGGPVISEENIIDWITVNETYAPHPKNCFMLRVTGDSMIDAGVLEGDTVIADQSKEPRNGDIVIALVDNENTIKRFIREGGIVYLKPENKKYFPIYPTNELQIQGVVVGLLRSY